jgi:hypothetical protein
VVQSRSRTDEFEGFAAQAGGKPTKIRRRSALKPKGRNASKALPRRGSTPAGQGTEVARLTRELNEALAREVVASEVLHIILSSRGDLQPVFASVLENAVRLSEAHFSVLLLKEGTTFRLVATHNAPPAYVGH